MLFATRVLLVEGATDREVVQGILTENEESKEDFTYISTHQIISVGGIAIVSICPVFVYWILTQLLNLISNK